MKKPIKHYLVNLSGQTVYQFETFDADKIKESIVKYLTDNPDEELTHEKDDPNRLSYGNTIVNFYGVNPKSKSICKIVIRGTKEYYQPLSL